VSALAPWVDVPEAAKTATTTQRAARLAARAIAAMRAREPLIWGMVTWVAYSALGIWLGYHYNAVMRDAFARLANAYYVLYSRDPHLEAIGFIWNPLPSLLMVPLLAFKGLWPALAHQGLAANLVSAPFGGLAVFAFGRLLRRFGLSGWLWRALVLLFALNPGLAFFAANGMTDLMLAGTMLATLDSLWAYVEGRRVSSLVASGLWTSVAFLIRYDVVFWAAVVAVAVAFGLARLPEYRATYRRSWQWIAGFLLVWMTPLIYAVTIWVFVNWMIMHDALYFLRGAYSNVAQNATGAYRNPELLAAWGHPLGALAFVARQTLLFPPVVVGAIGLLAVGLAGRRMAHAQALILAAATLGVPLLQLLLLYKGESDGWLRYFLSFIPFGFVSVVFLAQRLAQRGDCARPVIWGLCLAGIVAGNGLTAFAMLMPASPLRTERLQGYQEFDRVIGYLDAHPRLTVLTDTFLSFPIVLRIQRIPSTNFVVTSDRDFVTLLDHPSGHVDALLVPQPAKLGLLDAVNRRYQHLWDGGEPWAREIADFPDGHHWRLFLITPARRASTQSANRAPRWRDRRARHGSPLPPTRTRT